jgi:hypothetical protein
MHVASTPRPPPPPQSMQCNNPTNHDKPINKSRHCKHIACLLACSLASIECDGAAKRQEGNGREGVKPRVVQRRFDGCDQGGGLLLWRDVCVNVCDIYVCVCVMCDECVYVCVYL